jgi:hypothetical protein
MKRIGPRTNRKGCSDEDHHRGSNRRGSSTLAASGGATGRQTIVPSPAGIERYLLHPPDSPRGFFFEVPGGVKVGPILAAACRGEGPVDMYTPQGVAYYRRFICAARAHNAARLAILRILTPTPPRGFFKYQFLGWR